MVQTFKFSLENSSDPLFSLRTPAATLSSAPASQRQPLSLTPHIMAPAIVLSFSTFVPFTVVEPSALVVFLHAVGLLRTLAPPPDPNLADVFAAVTLSLGSQTPRVVPFGLFLLTPLDATATTGVSLTRQLTTAKRQRDAARWDLAAATAEPH